MGLDPGTAATGYGVVEQRGAHLTAVAYGVIETSAGHAGASPARHHLPTGGGGARSVSTGGGCRGVLVLQRERQTALAVGQARGVALLACSRSGCDLFEYTPQQVKLAVVGYGKAEKAQVQDMVRVLLHLDHMPLPTTPRMLWGWPSATLTEPPCGMASTARWRRRTPAGGHGEEARRDRTPAGNHRGV